ncbi:hypothetical protein JKP88DRAFT_251339 [Tribonema minus]|uniref:Histidine kinase domain-containing protein n=1 Tax=Tribonema minus TaxID=303371 RepID=A0A835ZDC1_9STRA|nr:hypothetical protein JKP88DRAFT_251339 [Tribonema minus]
MVAHRRQDPRPGGGQAAGAASVEIQLPAAELGKRCSGGKAGGDKSGKAAYLRRLALMVLHFGLYYATARLGLLMIISYVSLFWCGNGITFVFLFFAPLWEWPLYLVGATAALFLACLGFESNGLVLALAMCNVLELIGGGVLFRLLLKQLKLDPMVIGHERSLVPLMACTILPSMVAALPGALAVERWYPDCSMWQPYASWAFAHSTGNYTTAYLILVIRKSIFEETGKGAPSRQLLHIMKNRLTGMNRSTLRPAMEYCVCLAIMGFIFLSNMVPVAGLLLFPVLGWVSLRFSQMLSAVMVSWTTMVVIVSMILGRRMWLDFDRHPGEADDERATLANMLIMHTTLFLAVLTTQFVSINIQAKNRALQHIRSSAAEKQAFFQHIRSSAAEKQAFFQHIRSSTTEKQAFFQHVSHEFRTPLSVIIGFCEALEASPLDRQQQEQLQCMSNAGNMLSKIVDDLLELFRMEVGSAKLHLERTELVPFFFNCCRVSFRALEDVPRIVMLDQTRLQQIMYNLGSNAVKYSNAGHVSILLSRVAPKKREGACKCGETAVAGKQANGKSAAKSCTDDATADDATAVLLLAAALRLPPCPWAKRPWFTPGPQAPPCMHSPLLCWRCRGGRGDGGVPLQSFTVWRKEEIVGGDVIVAREEWGCASLGADTTVGSAAATLTDVLVTAVESVLVTGVAAMSLPDVIAAIELGVNAADTPVVTAALDAKGVRLPKLKAVLHHTLQ